MSRRPQSRIHPVWRRGARGVLVGLTSLTLVLSGGASLAAPQDEPDLTEDVADAVELAEPSLEEATTPAVDATAPADSATEEPDDTALDTAEPVAEEAAGEGSAEEDTADVPAAAAPAATDDTVTPLFVPPGEPGPGEVKLIARAGGDRTGTGAGTSTATPLAGATFEFFRVTSFPDDGPPVGTSVGTCTTDVSGECGIFADLTGELDGSDVFYAAQTGAPAGWVAPSQWAPGPEGAYIFATGLIDADDSVDDRTVELPLAFNDTVTEPAWASVRPNNAAPPQCGIDVAMVGDLSNSVTESDELLQQHKDAAYDFIDALTGTPSRIALYTFASLAPAQGAGNEGFPLTSVATAAGNAALKTHIAGNSQPPAGGGGTNWDRGFHQVVESGETYDVVLFLTDGQPTFHRDRQGPGDVSTIAEVNEAILSANAVKATGAQVILVGIGPEAFLEGASIRIPLVSGPTEGVDFYRTNLDELGETLQEIASANCAGTLTVVKEVEEPDGDVVPGGAGWTFSTDTTDVTPASGTTDATGAVNFQVGYTGDELTRPVTITETQQEGFELSQVDGQNAVCVNTLDGTGRPVTNAGALGFTVDVAAEDIVSCTVRNTSPDYADLTVTKTAVPTYDRDWDWDITKVAEVDSLVVPPGEDGTFTYDVTVTPEGPTDSGFQLAGTITVTNPNDVPFAGVSVVDSVNAPSGGTCTVPGGTGVAVGAGASVTLPYTCTITDVTATTAGTNEVTATWDAAAYPGTGGSATATATFDFAGADVSETDRYVTVTDSELDLSELSGGNTFDATDGEQVLTYDLTWPSTPGQCETFDNTATITNTPGSDVGLQAVTGSSTETVEVCSPILEHEKTVVSTHQQADGSWEVRYEIDVVNDTDYPGTYSLSDTIEYGDGITPTQAVWFPEDEPEAGGSWTGLPDERTEVLATDVDIAAGETHTYVVMVTAEVAAGVVGTDAGQCDDDEADGGGFLNAATLTAPGQEDTDRACTEPVAPSVTKTAGELTDNDDGTWAVSYTVDVSNDDADQTVTYDLRDELGFAEGVDILAATVERDGTAYPAWDGVTQTEITTGVELPAGTTHTYSVTVTVDLAAVTGADRDGVRGCGDDAEAGDGLFNRAVIISGADEYDDDACLPVPGLGWTLTKSSDPASGSVVRPGERIDYTVTATPTGDAAPTDLVVRDDISRVLDNARGTGTIEVSTGSFEWDGDVLVWHIPELTEPATLTYSVIVDDDAWGVTLRNVVTGAGPPPPACVDDCTTTHTTPPPPQWPQLPRTGSEVFGAALLAVVLSLGGAALIRRREEA